MKTTPKTDFKKKTHICLILIFLFISQITSSAKTEDPCNIELPAQQAETQNNQFMKDSFNLRMQYYLKNAALDSEDANELFAIAQAASQNLSEIAKQQEEIKLNIENYTKSDWEEKFGQTGLWQKAAKDLYLTSFYKLQADYYKAIASKPPEQADLLHSILSGLDNLDKSWQSANQKILKARTLALLAEMDSSYKTLAMVEFGEILELPNIDSCTRLNAAVEIAILSNSSQPDQLSDLTEKYIYNICTESIEPSIRLISLLQQAKQYQLIEDVISNSPELKNVFSSIMLAMVNKSFIRSGQINVNNTFEAEIMADGLKNANPSEYHELLLALTGNKYFKAPYPLYSAAILLKDSMPLFSIDLFMQTAELQKKEKTDRLIPNACGIAELAAKLAYKQFLSQSSDCSFFIRTFEQYENFCYANINEDLEYAYAVSLGSCGSAERSIARLEQISQKAEGKFRNRAIVDLIHFKLQQNTPLESEQKNLYMEQLSEIITGSTQDSELFIEAKKIYCQLVLQSDSLQSANQAMEILSEMEDANDIQVKVLISKALTILENWGDAAEILKSAIDANDCSFKWQQLEFLNLFAEKIDNIQDENENFSTLIEDCVSIAEDCYNCFEESRKYPAAILFAEMLVFLPENKPANIDKAERLLASLKQANQDNDPTFIRVKARLLTEKGQYRQAGQLWAKLCETAKAGNANQNSPDWQWWRGMYFKLYCISRLPDTSHNEIEHAVEILFNSYEEIPLLWAKRLETLKKAPVSSG